jgi:hypothetical protein
MLSVVVLMPLKLAIITNKRRGLVVGRTNGAAKARSRDCCTGRPDVYYTLTETHWVSLACEVYVRKGS